MHCKRSRREGRFNYGVQSCTVTETEGEKAGKAMMREKEGSVCKLNTRFFMQEWSLAKSKIKGGEEKIKAR